MASSSCSQQTTEKSFPDSQPGTTIENQKLSFWTKLAYASGGFGNNFIFGIMTLYLMLFYTDYFGISAAAVGTLFLVVRIWDAMINPVMGMIVDNTQSRWGKFRPYLLFAPLIVGVTTTLCFTSPDFSATGKLIFAYITYILWGTSFAAIDIPYWSMSAALSEDPDERNTIVMMPRTLATVGFNIVAVVCLPMVQVLGRGNSRLGFFYVALIFSIGAVLFTWITFFFCRESVRVERKEGTSIKDAARMIWLNRPLQLVVIGQLLIDIIYCIKGALPLYYMKYVLDAEGFFLGLGGYLPGYLNDYVQHYVQKLGAENLLISLSMVIGLVFMLAGCVSAPWFCSKFGKKWVTVGGNFVAAVAGILFYFTEYSVVNFFGFGVIIIVGTSMANISLMSMLIDTVEYGEWKTGRRLEGVIFSLNTFRAQLSMGIGGALGAYGLAAVKYVPNVAQTTETVKGIHLLFSLVPGVLSLFATMLYLCYDLTEKRYEIILKEVIERRKENK